MACAADIVYTIANNSFDGDFYTLCDCSHGDCSSASTLPLLFGTCDFAPEDRPPGRMEVIGTLIV